MGFHDKTRLKSENTKNEVGYTNGQSRCLPFI